MANTKNSGNVNLSSAQRIRCACAVIVPLFFFSLLLAAALISAANDIYAFSKSDGEVTLTFDNPDTVYDAAKLLGDSGIINNPCLFSLYVCAKGVDGRILGFSGEISLSASMSYREILAAFS